MKYNFDEIINRTNTNSLKYDFASERNMPDGLIPLWVADMDFRTAPAVTQALIKSAEYSVFGYTETKLNGEYYEAVRNWFSSRFDFNIKPEWLVKTPGVVYAISMAVRAFTEVSERIMIQTPVYYPFYESIETNGRVIVRNPLIYGGGKFSIDFNDFEQKIVENDVKMFILCSPHNPVGRVWTKDELTEMGDICYKHNVLIVSDEIHCDFIFGENKHTIFGAIKDSFLSNSIICTSPSKTFNLAGLQLSNVFIENNELRQKFSEEIVKTGYEQHNTMGIVSCQAAYESGGEWLDELIKYIEKNYLYMKSFLNKNLPEIKLTELEGTYLAWLDLNSYGFSKTELDNILVEKAGLWVNRGIIFGDEGRGFIRINIACPLSTLECALNKLHRALV